MSRAVSMMIGTACGADRLQASVPESRGSVTSSTTRSTASDERDRGCLRAVGRRLDLELLALEGVLQAAQDRRLVVDDQDAGAHAACCCFTSGRTNPDGRSRHRAPTRARSRRRGRPPSRVRSTARVQTAWSLSVCAIEAIEDPALVAVRNAIPGVGDLDEYVIPFFAAAKRDAARRRVLGGVEREVDERLFDEVGVRCEEQGVRAVDLRNNALLKRYPARELVEDVAEPTRRAKLVRGAARSGRRASKARVSRVRRSDSGSMSSRNSSRTAGRSSHRSAASRSR